MEKSSFDFPASAALHGGRFRDRTLRAFEERRLIDPDDGTIYEGTVEELPPPDEWPMKAFVGKGPRKETDEPVSFFHARQSSKRRSARLREQRKREAKARATT